MPFDDIIDDPIDDNLEINDNELYEDEDAQDLLPPRPPVACQTTESLKAFHAAQGTTGEQWREAVVEVLDFMKSKTMNTTLFLHHLFWNTPEIIDDGRCKYERTSVTHSKELEGVLRNLYRPPRKHNKGFRSQGAVATMTKIAGEITSRQINREMRALGPVLESAPADFNEKNLLETKLETMIPQVKAAAPLWWSICRNAAFTPQQAARNTKKSDPDTVSNSRAYLC